MFHDFTLAALLPTLTPFHHTGIHQDGATRILGLTPITPTAACPVCQDSATHIHSRYRRTLADLPLAGQRIVLQIQARRFVCRNAACVRRIFCERLTPLAAAYHRHTTALVAALRRIGLALGGKAPVSRRIFSCPAVG